MNKRPFKAAIIGSPVAHSLSPVIHNFWLKEYGLPGRYDTQEIQSEKLSADVRRLIEQGYTGFNVTAPHKQAMLEICDSVDETARAIGAINTVKITETGAMEGSNTDWFGFVESLREGASDFEFFGKSALVLGAGGAARAVVYGLKRQNFKRIAIANRTRAAAEKLARQFDVNVIDWQQRNAAMTDIALVVNTTSLGMTDQPPLELDLKQLPGKAIVCDIVYKPRITGLLQAARRRGNVTVEGLGMLLHQARPAFERWTGILPDVTDDLKEALLRRLEKK